MYVGGMLVQVIDVVTGPTGSLHIQQLAATLPKLVILTSTDIIL